jgi:hypothetical protein
MAVDPVDRERFIRISFVLSARKNAVPLREQIGKILNDFSLRFVHQDSSK